MTYGTKISKYALIAWRRVEIVVVLFSGHINTFSSDSLFSTFFISIFPTFQRKCHQLYTFWRIQFKEFSFCLHSHLFTFKTTIFLKTFCILAHMPSYASCQKCLIFSVCICFIVARLLFGLMGISKSTIKKALTLPSGVIVTLILFRLVSFIFTFYMSFYY